MKLIVSWHYATPTISRRYGLAYSNFACAQDIYYPIPINYILRYSRKLYWRFLRIWYWIGLIDVGEAEAFSWRDFYRIKSHH